MSLFSPLLAVCCDPEEAPAITELARRLGYPDAHVVAGGIRDAIDALNARITCPDYILIDIGERGTSMLPELDELALHCEPHVRVAVVGGINDISFYRELKSRGVLEYFPRPVQPADIRAVLIQTSAQVRLPVSPAAQGTVISCMSAGSGDGGSTLALNLAYCLAEMLKQPTVLVDMDYQFGLVTKSLDLTAPFGIREIFDHPDRGLDNMLIDKMLVKYGERLSIIAAPGELRLLPPIRPEVIRELVSILRARFAFVVFDVPHIWTDWTAAALTYSDHAVMVAQLWLRSLAHASRLLSSWQQVGIAREATSLVINRSGAKFREAITPTDFERICRQRIATFIPNDAKAVSYAETHGKTIFEAGQGVAMQQQIKALAQELAKRRPGGEIQEPAGKKKLLALFEKKLA